MPDDPELTAMRSVMDALTDLPLDTVERVLQWAARRFDVSLAHHSPAARTRAARGTAEERTENDERPFDDFASLFDAANPATAVDNALVAAYWAQVVKGQGDFDSYSINKELKHLGHPSTNITRDLGALMERSPRLVMQVRKSGTSRQARKRYKVTTEGVRAVERMIHGD